MATILIVDDRPANREYLVSLLGYGGHRLLEAGDGAEALATAKTVHLDLVIADILMPTMDGFEFVRRLRADPAVSAIPVIFFTAHFLEREAHNLARACGIAYVLTKPAEPEVVLRTVDAALGVAPPPPAAPPTEEFDREHLRLLTDKLSQKADELRRANERLSAMIDLGLELGSERDPRILLQHFCNTARDIVGARYAVVGILDGDGVHLRYFFTSGMDAETVARLGTPDPGQGGVATVLREIRCLRRHDPSGDFAAPELPPTYPPVRSWLGAPIVSPAKVYGWLALLDKVGADAFGAEDERLAGILTAQVGRIYENGSLYADVLRHASALELEVGERQRAEADLREGERRYRELFEANPHPMWVFDVETLRFLAVNDAAVAQYGYSRDEFLSMRITDIRPADEVPTLLEELRRAAPEFQSRGAWRHRRQDGTVREVEISSHALRYGGRPARLVLALDVTERRRAEEELRRTADLLRAVAEGTTDAVFVKDREGRYLFFNPAAARFVGRPVAEVLGKDDTALFDADSARRAMENDRRVMVNGQAETAEERLTAAGVTRTYLASKAPYRDERGHIVGVIGISRDITDRIAAEEALRDVQCRLRHVVTSSPAVLFTLAVADEQIRGIRWVSDNLQGMLGYPPEAALQADWWMGHIHPDERDQIIAQTHAELFHHGRVTHEYRFRHGDGSYRWTRGELRLIRDAAGRAVEAVGAWTDITERKLLEDQFRQAQKMEAVGRLAGGVAHDFNNLLTVINGYGELVLSKLPAADPNRELIREIVAAGDRATGLTRQLLAFSRKAVLEPRVLDLRVLVANLDKMVRRIVGEDIQLTVAADPEVGAVKADPGQIEQVILNLVVNARDAMPTGGRLTIEVRNVALDESYARTHTEARPGPHVLLAVSDTGYGMDAATLNRIFEPFFSTKGEKGTGLGLATVHGIVKQSGGHVAVYSEVGHGTTFKAYLPRVDQRPAARTSSRDAAGMPRGSETVLLVEDDDSVRSLSRYILQACGYAVLEARDGAEAVCVAEGHAGRLDLLLTDVVLPRLGGREAAERIRQARPGLKVLFLSGYTDDAVVRHGILAAEVAFLQKPFSPMSLAVKVRDVLDGK